MNDVRGADSSADDKRKQLIQLFLRRSFGDVEQMRRTVPRLVAGDPATWQDLRFAAQRMAGTAQGLELGILATRAKELARLADEKFAGITLDAHFLLSATTAIEMVAIELNRLFAEYA